MPSYKFQPSAQWLKESPEYQIISDFADGSVSTVSKYLVKYGSERAETIPAQAHFASRVERLANENEIDPPLQIHLGHMATQAIQFGELADNEAFSKILDDVTGYEDSANDMFRERLRLYWLHGMVGTLVDGPSAIADTKADAEANNERSYQLIFDACQIVKWSHFASGPRKGQFSEVILSQGVTTDDAGTEFEQYARYFFPGGGASENEVFSKQILTAKEPSKTGWIRAEEREFEITDEKPGGLTRIPFVIHGRGLRDSKVRLGVASNRKLLNDNSMLDNQLYYTGNQRSFGLGISGDGIKWVAEHTFICIENAPEHAKIHTIEAGDPSGLAGRIDREKNFCRRVMMFEFNQLANEDSKESPSAESKAMDMKGRISVYDQTLDMFQRKDTQIYRFHAEYEGLDPETVQISIAREFELDDPAQQDAKDQVTVSFARQLGGEAFDSILKQVLKSRLMEMKLVPEDGETEDEALQALFKVIDETTTQIDLTQAVPGNNVDPDSQTSKRDPLGELAA